MKYIKKNLLNLVLIVLFLCTPTLAEENKANIENYVSNDFKNRISKMDSYVAYFVQKELDKDETYGAVIFKKNVGIRFNYFEPHPILLTITKKNVYLYDYEMENLSIVKASESPIYFLLKQDIDFDERLRIIKATKDKNFYYIDLFHVDTETIVSIVYDYVENQISSIDVLDHNKQNIGIIFEKTIKIDNANTKIDNEIFKIKNPKIYGKPKRFDKNEIEKLYAKD
jgi:outer membrane lipoprotein-sorting protein